MCVLCLLKEMKNQGPVFFFSLKNVPPLSLPTQISTPIFPVAFLFIIANSTLFLFKYLK